jgi:O-antigen ligase
MPRKLAHTSTKTNRSLALASLIAMVLGAAMFAAARQAQQVEARGTVAGFPQPYHGAEQLRIGVNAALDQYDDATLEARLRELAQQGVQYVRQEFRWADIEKTKGVLDWANSDRMIASTQKHGMQILVVLLTTPQWARPLSRSSLSPSPESTPPENVEDFARFATAFAQRYSSAKWQIPSGNRATHSSSLVTLPYSPILGFQIWDEPNLSEAWGNNLISPAAYLKLLFAAGDAIRAVQPTARIVLAGLAPTTETNQVHLAPQEFLRRLYQLGGHDAFDIAAAKPYGYDFAPTDRRVQADTLNFSHMILLREVMDAHGDTQKAIWATEFGWNALPPNWQGEKSIWGTVTASQQAEFALAAVQRAAREWPWLGAMFIDTLQPRANPQRTRDDVLAVDAAWGFAMLDQTIKPRPIYSAIPHMLRAAAQAARANFFAQCHLPPRLMKQWLDPNIVRDKADAMNAVPLHPQNCYLPNPLAEFSKGWRFSALGADIPDTVASNNSGTVRVRFSGDAFALIVRRAGREYRAYTFVTIDGQPANLLPREARGAYLIMNSADFAVHVETIPVATNLGPGEHVAEITLDGGWNLWGLVGWSSQYTLYDSRLTMASWLALALGVAGLIGLGWAWPRANWPGWLRNKPMWQPSFWHIFVTGLLTWLAASLTWVQDAASAYRNLGTPLSLSISAFTSAIAFWSPLLVVSLVALAVLLVLVLLRLDLGLTLLAFFIPFYLLPQRLWAYAFSMAELLVLMCAASWMLQKMKLQQLKMRDWRLTLRQSLISTLQPQSLTLLDWSVLALVVVSVASALQAQFRTEALRELRVVIVESALLYAILRTTQLHDTQRWRIVHGFVVGACVVAVLGLINYARGDFFVAEFGLPRIKSVYGSPNNDALYLGRALPVVLAAALAGLSGKGKGQYRTAPAARSLQPLLYVFILIPITLALLLTQSRGALLLGTPAAVAAVCWCMGGRWRWVAIGLAAAVVLGMVILLSGVAAPLLQGTRLAHALDLQRGTGFFRVNLWQSALRMWQDFPLLGVGPDNFLYAYRSFYILPAAWQEPNLSHPHNAVLDFATRLGVLGLLCGVGLVVGLAKNIRRALGVAQSNPTAPAAATTPALAIATAGFLAEVLAHGLVDHSFFLVDLAFGFMLFAGLTARKSVQHHLHAERRLSP